MPHWLFVGCVLFAIAANDPRFGESYKITGFMPNGTQEKKFYLIDGHSDRAPSNFCVYFEISLKR